ncbi:MAG: leucine-rich repeat domain-containing protein [Thermoplasmata archaeon]|nr:leucine-rich repeat domain-containing protein [Thermoplasmata archaeon]
MYESESSVYTYTVWGSGTESSPYGSTLEAVETSEDVLYVQSALEGYPLRTVSSLGTCGASAVVLPDTVRTVEAGAFDGCANLEAVYFLGDKPDIEGEIPVPCIRLEGTSGWGSEEVLELEEVSAGGSVVLCYTISGEATVHALSSGTDVAVPSATADGTPITSVGDGAFEGTSVASVSLSDGIWRIGVRAFHSCQSLVSADLPDSLLAICGEAFRDCVGMGNVDLPDVTFIGFEAFRDCRSMTSISIPDSVTEIRDGAFYLCRAARSLELGAGVTSVPARCFGYLDQLQTVDLSGVTALGAYAFYDCVALESVDLGSVESVGARAFGGCYGLCDVGRLGSATDVGDYAFQGCRSLTSVTFAGTLETLGAYAFYDCRQLETVSFEGDMPSIGEGAIPSGTVAEIRSSHSSSWSGYEGEVRVLDDGSAVPWIPIIVVLVAVVAAAVFVVRRRTA